MWKVLVATIIAVSVLFGGTVTYQVSKAFPSDGSVQDACEALEAFNLAAAAAAAEPAAANTTTISTIFSYDVVARFLESSELATVVCPPKDIPVVDIVEEEENVFQVHVPSPTNIVTRAKIWWTGGLDKSFSASSYAFTVKRVIKKEIITYKRKTDPMSVQDAKATIFRWAVKEEVPALVQSGVSFISQHLPNKKSNNNNNKKRTVRTNFLRQRQNVRRSTLVTFNSQLLSPVHFSPTTLRPPRSSSPQMLRFPILSLPTARLLPSTRLPLPSHILLPTQLLPPTCHPLSSFLSTLL